MKIPGGQGPLAVVDQHCVSVEKLVFWIILTIAVLVIFIGRAKMKVRFSLVLVSLSAILLMLYANTTYCGLRESSRAHVASTIFDDFAHFDRKKYLMELRHNQIKEKSKEDFTLEELEELVGKALANPQMEDVLISHKNEFEKYNLTLFGHFNEAEFVTEHKKLCIELTEKFNRREKLLNSGISAKQAAMQYSGRLPIWEIDELQSGTIDSVYFAGIKANKTKRFAANITNNFGFDDADEENKGRYRWTLGDHINYRFEVIKYLGGGTYGEVLKVIDHKFKEEVAVKMLNNYTSIAKHTMTEYNILTRINNTYPNSNFFIRNTENFKFRNHFCMVFELLAESAYDLYDRENFRTDENSLKRYVSDILKGMVLLNTLGIIHNDMKPDNLLLPISHKNENEPKIKVMDFGLSCVKGSQTTKCPEYYIQTRYYRSPEVMLALGYTTMSDMWSLGVIIGEMFRGSEFIFGESEADQFAAVMEIVGLPPVELIERSNRRKIYYEAVCYETKKGFKRRPYRKSITKTLLLDTPDHDLFLDFLQRLLRWDPIERMSAVDALNHPWITGDLEDFSKLPREKPLISP